ncbi:MAG: hypothetical protein IJI20_04205 [Firmicutes bacterium]|nr:hypothetical protein [Bacillota bacterium]
MTKIFSNELVNGGKDTASAAFTVAENGNSAETGDDGNVLLAFILMALSILVSGIAAFRIVQTKHTIN